MTEYDLTREPFPLPPPGDMDVCVSMREVMSHVGTVLTVLLRFLWLAGVVTWASERPVDHPAEVQDF